jgi:hypothetical protein
LVFVVGRGSVAIPQGTVGVAVNGAAGVTVVVEGARFGGGFVESGLVGVGGGDETLISLLKLEYCQSARSGLGGFDSERSWAPFMQLDWPKHLL